MGSVHIFIFLWHSFECQRKVSPRMEGVCGYASRYVIDHHSGRNFTVLLEQGIEAVMVKDDAILRKQATEKGW